MSQNKEWDDFFNKEIEEDYYKSLMSFLDREYAEKEIFPPRADIFKAFELTAYQKVKIVILGQDPYHGKNQAHGLAFSVMKGEKIPPSLKNIYKTLEIDCQCKIPQHGNLIKWSQQGVLLLNTVLTVESGQAASHKKKGWETFTDHVIQYLNQRPQGMVFLLWGAHAHKKEALITGPQHLILKAVHPSPLSARRGFFDCGHFSAANKFLESQQEKTIDWQIED